jgi:hypothetical protein
MSAGQYQDSEEDFIFDHNGADDFGGGNQLPAVQQPGGQVARQPEPQPRVPAASDTPSPRDLQEFDDHDDSALVSEAISSLMRPGGRPRDEITVRTPVETRPAPQQPTAPGRIGQGTQQQDQPVDRHVQGILRELQETRRELAELKRGAAQPRQTEQGPDFETRFFSDPQGVLQEVTQNFAQQLATVQLDSDLKLAEIRHGSDVFKTAFEAYMGAVGDGNNFPLYQRVMSAPSPGEEIMRWHRENTLLQETGGDIEAFRQRIREQVLQELQGGGQAGQPSGRAAAAQDAPRRENGQFAPRHEVRLPTATSRMNGSQVSGNEDLEDGSDDAIFDAGRAPRTRR